MSLEQKLEYFKKLVEIGFKEIEIGFPAASETEFELARTLIENDMIPEDVTIQVLTQAREHIIKKTFNALEGCKTPVIIHVYNSCLLYTSRYRLHHFHHSPSLCSLEWRLKLNPSNPQFTMGKSLGAGTSDTIQTNLPMRQMHPRSGAYLLHNDVFNHRNGGIPPNLPGYRYIDQMCIRDRLS